MLKFFSKCFEAICCVFIVINFIFFAILGFNLGDYTAKYFMLYDSVTLFKWLFAVGGVAIAFFVNVFVFGFVSQVIEIKHLLENKN